MLLAAAMLPIAPAAASTAAGLEGCDIFLCGGNHNEGAAVDRPGTAEQVAARASRAVAALAVAATLALPVSVPASAAIAAGAAETCPTWECGSNHSEGAAVDRPGTAEQVAARAGRAVAALAVVAAVGLPISAATTAANAADICTVSECGTNHNEGAARDGIGPG